MSVALVMFKEDGARKEFPIDSGKTVVGRKEDCDLRIPLAEISRKHAMIIVEKDAATLRDLGSANGTYVNNKRISEQELTAGDHIVIGPVVFTVQINGVPSDVRPVQTRLEARTTVPAQASGSDMHGTAKDGVFTPGEDDPITALEAMAASDDTATLDLDDSFHGLDEARV